jgi:enediyne biosynthesis protein E4
MKTRTTPANSWAHALALALLGLLTLNPALLCAQPLEFFLQPTDFWHTVSPGATVQNRARVTGGTVPYAYQWRFKGDPIAWATKPIITLTNVQPADAGPYDVVVSDGAGASVTSEIDELKVNEAFIMITGSPVTTNSIGTCTAAWFDYDNDDYVDLFNGEDSISSTIRDANLYHNNQDGTFSMVTNAVTTYLGKWSSGAVGDFNNDGRLDLFVGRFTNQFQNMLYRNDDGGVFTAVETRTFNSPAGNVEAAAWADYDRDGFLDLLVSNGSQISGSSGEFNTLYRNLGDGTFQRMTANEIGSLLSAQVRSVGGCLWGDFDNDGDPDVWDSGYQNGGLHWNDGQGRFTLSNVGSLPTGVSAVTGCVDYDNDGFLDLIMFVGPAAAPETGRIELHHNLGGTNFEEVATSAGITRFCSDIPWPGGWGDYDNDGWLDLLCHPLRSTEPGVLFRNRGDGTFEAVDIGSPVYDGVAHAGGGAWADFNNDGFLDLFVNHGQGVPHPNFLYRNNLRALGNSNHWLKIKLDGQVSNRAGIGAKVRVHATVHGRTFWQLREISGNAYWTAGGPLLIAHFGLGDATHVTTLRIEWPSGIVQEFQDIAADQHLTMVESQGQYPGPTPAIIVASATTDALQLTLQEPETGWQYALEGSTDLEHWAMLLARTSAGGTQSFTDTRTTNYPARFYRVIVP